MRGLGPPILSVALALVILQKIQVQRSHMPKKKVWYFHSERDGFVALVQPATQCRLQECHRNCHLL